MRARKLDFISACRQPKPLLVDTSVLIEEFRDFRILPSVPRPQRRTSIVAIWEFLHRKDGKTLSRVERRDRMEWLRRLGIETKDLHIGTSTTFRALLDDPSGPPGAVDCMLAAESLARGWPFVTFNVRHFRDVRGLVLVDTPPKREKAER